MAEIFVHRRRHRQPGGCACIGDALLAGRPAPLVRPCCLGQTRAHCLLPVWSCSRPHSCCLRPLRHQVLGLPSFCPSNRSCLYQPDRSKTAVKMTNETVSACYGSSSSVYCTDSHMYSDRVTFGKLGALRVCAATHAPPWHARHGGASAATIRLNQHTPEPTHTRPPACLLACNAAH